MAEYVPLEIPDNQSLPKILFILGVRCGVRDCPLVRGA